ncbi:hypothetical protein SDC9_146447 [bioreactor metagenome]|uniref:Uncharacterized protein n=1 Tax=bioreactor metagenome TaxID=1076179 RepID=A0A645EC42_9ZZZZ
MFLLNSEGSICLMSMPSISIFPSWGLYKPKTSLLMVVLPDPIGPIRATFSPALMVKETFESAGLS